MTHVHLIGIGGTGLSAIARVLLESGYTVSGSDRQMSPLAASLQAAGARVDIGHSPENVAGADLVIRSSAIQDSNSEVQAALAAGIPVYKRADFLGRLLEGRLGIAVAGSHGKTTTTAMIAWLLVALDQDPSFIIGGLAHNLGTNAHAGRGPAFVIEADEYDRMFLGLRPQVAVVTNVEHDHPDCYPTAESFYAAFREFSSLLREEGVLIVCAGDTGSRRLGQDAAASGQQVRSYGIAAQGPGENGSAADLVDYLASNLAPNARGGFRFEFSAVCASRDVPVTCDLQVPGRHNVLNATAALAVAHVLGLPLEQAAEALGRFQGTGRRFELRGEARGVTVIDDYAHNPTKIRAVLAAARDRYPGRRIVAVWQPHTYSRTLSMLDDFAVAFADADLVVVTDVYAARETAPAGFSPGRVAEALAHPAVHFAPALDEAAAHLLAQLRRGDVLLVLSAGDADRVSTQVLAGLRAGSQPVSERARRQLPARLHAGVWRALQQVFGERLQVGVPLTRYTAARLGGRADVLLELSSADELAQAVQLLWEADEPYILLGGGSNVLVSDAGVRQVVLLNRARTESVRFDENAGPPTVWAEAGVNFGLLARLAASRGLAGLEWAAGIPGTLGGAVFGNAGAHGGDMAGSLLTAEILQPGSRQQRHSWPVEKMAYEYRSSLLKRRPDKAVILSALLRLERSTPEKVLAKMDEYVAFRHRTQPPGASMGSMFKNPPGDYAGRLIEAAGLKGARQGEAQISPLHANIFINHGQATAADVFALIRLARQAVAEKFGVQLELEVELIGEW